MWRAGYRLLLWLAFPFVLARLWWRGRHEPGYRQNVGERFGFYGAKPERRGIWVAAVAAGATRAAQSLLDTVPSRHPAYHLLLSLHSANRPAAALQPLYGSRDVTCHACADR